ncbi:MAG: AMP-binding protein [Ilumatobacteraceae bacterium]
MSTPVLVRPATVASMFLATVERDGDRLALVERERRLTWDELAAEATAVAGALHARGVTPGDGVAVVLGNDEAFVSSFLGVQLAGAMAVPLNPQFNVEELARHLAVAPVTGIVAAPATAARFTDRDLASWVATPSELSGTPSAGPPVEPDPAAPALLAFSSGSTGTPKGMIRSNANLTAEADHFTATVGITGDDVFLAVVALFHAHGLGNALLASLRSGAPLVTGPFERDATLAAIRDERVTIFPAVPFIFRTLAETRRATRHDLASLRLCISAGAPLDQETAVRFAERFGVPIRQLYGCSEAGSVTIDLAPDTRRGSVGRPMRGIDVTIVDDTGAPVAAGTTGEITFRSAALTAGYVGSDATDASPFADAWFRTGDLGHVDAAGDLFITGRTKLFISTSGYKVDPFEVEAVLLDQPGVAEVVVVGTPDERGEEVVKAVVVPDRADLDEDALRTALVDACRARLAPFKVPRIVELRAEIPRSPLGKILRKYLV